MKCHVGADAGTGYVHTIEVTPSNDHDVTVASKLVREDDEVVYGDSGYLGIQKRPNAIGWTRWIERRKSSVRCKVEHIFRVIKCQFGSKSMY